MGNSILESRGEEVQQRLREEEQNRAAAVLKRSQVDGKT